MPPRPRRGTRRLATLGVSRSATPDTICEYTSSGWLAAMTASDKFDYSITQQRGPADPCFPRLSASSRIRACGDAGIQGRALARVAPGTRLLSPPAARAGPGRRCRPSRPPAYRAGQAGPSVREVRRVPGSRAVDGPPERPGPGRRDIAPLLASYAGDAVLAFPRQRSWDGEYRGRPVISDLREMRLPLSRGGCGHLSRSAAGRS